MKLPLNKENNMEADEEYIGKRTEEVADIIEIMPMNFGRWIACAVCAFALLFLLFGWFIKYPDTVTGEVVIGSNMTPIKLVAGASGKIALQSFRTQSIIKEGTYIAVIENSASTKDMVKLHKLLEQFDFIDFLQKQKRNEGMQFPNKMSLGELNTKYSVFLNALYNLTSFYKENTYEERLRSLETSLTYTRTLLDQSQEIHSIANERLVLAEKWYHRYEKMNRDVVNDYEQEVDNNKSEYLSSLQNEKDLEKSITSLYLEIGNDEHQIALLILEKAEKLKQMQLDLSAAYHDLKDNLQEWENKYVLKAPFTGKLEQLDFLFNGMYIESGTPLFVLIPKQQVLLGHMYLPAEGAGKVGKNSKVKIKLQDFPYTEYGTLEGRVSSISLVSSDFDSKEKSRKVYLILVNLKQGLRTNFGQQLPFKYNMIGEADIIVQERRLLTRLFDNLKYQTK